jgi:hypothetical protein
MGNPDVQQDGNIRDPHRVTGRDEMTVAIADAIGKTSRKLAIYAPSLNPAFFSSTSGIEALTAFCTASPQNRVRFLVEQGDRTIRENGRLVNLARRISDLIEIRQIGEETAATAEMFMIFDTHGYLHQADSEKAQCVVDPDDSTRAGAFSNRFDRMWERSVVINGLHVLGLGR